LGTKKTEIETENFTISNSFNILQCPNVKLKIPENFNEESFILHELYLIVIKEI
jgi:hypothetical protein